MFLTFLFIQSFSADTELCAKVEGSENINCEDNYGHLIITGYGTIPKITNFDSFNSIAITANEGQEIHIAENWFPASKVFQFIELKGKITFVTNPTIKADSIDLTLSDESLATTPITQKMEAPILNIYLNFPKAITLCENAFASITNVQSLSLTSTNENSVTFKQVFGNQLSLQSIYLYDKYNSIIMEVSPFLACPNLYSFEEEARGKLRKSNPFGYLIKKYTITLIGDSFTIDSTSFSSFPNVEILDFQIEAKTTITPNAFSNLQKLKEISIDYDDGSIVAESNPIPPSVKILKIYGAPLDLGKLAASTIEHLEISFETEYVPEEGSSGYIIYPKIEDQLSGFTSLKDLIFTNGVVITSKTFNGLKNLQSLTLYYEYGLDNMFDASVTENSISVANLTFNYFYDVDINNYIKYFNKNNIKSLQFTNSFQLSSPITVNNLEGIGFPLDTQLEEEAQGGEGGGETTTKRSLKSALSSINFDKSKITSVTYFMSTTGTSSTINTKQQFPNVKSITLGGGVYTVDDAILNGFTGTLTLPPSYEVNEDFIGKVQDMTIVADEHNGIYNFADGVFYSSDYRSITGIVPQSETVVVREGITTIDSTLFSENKKVKSITLPSTVQTIEEGSFVGCSSLTNLRCNSDTVDVADSIFDANSKVTVSVPPTYPGDTFGGKDVTREEDPNKPDEDPDKPAEDPDDGTNVGLIVGVVIAVVVVVAAVCVGVFFFLRKRKQQDTATGEDNNVP